MKRIESIEVCRGVAAGLVALFHASSFVQSPAYFSEVPVLGLADWGDAGVDFFFVLSGFIICWTNTDRIGLPNHIGVYLWKRFARIYPIYWVITLALIAAYFLLPLQGEGYEREIGAIIGSLTLFPVTEYPILPVGWTLSYEVFFYGIFGLVLLHARFGLVAILIWQGASLANFLIDADMSPWAAFVCNPLNLHFGLGMCAAFLFRQMSVHLAGYLMWIAALAMLGLGLASVYFGIERGVPWRFAFAFFSAVFVASLACQELQREFRIHGSLLLLGAASYSVYLVHYPLQLMLVKVFKFGEPWVALPASLIFAVVALASIMAGILLHLRVERPLTTWVRNLATRRRAGLFMGANN